jgi:preprotein translocase subunit SecE
VAWAEPGQWLAEAGAAIKLGLHPIKQEEVGWTTRVKNEEAETGIGFAVPRPVSKLGEYPRRWRQFLHEVRIELRQVTWPTRNDVGATTTVVIITVFFFALFLWVVDIAVQQLEGRVFQIFRP